MQPHARQAVRQLVALLACVAAPAAPAQFLAGATVSYKVSNDVSASLVGDSLTIAGIDGPLFRYENSGLIEVPETFDFSVKVLPQLRNDLTSVAVVANGSFNDSGGVLVLFGEALPGAMGASLARDGVNLKTTGLAPSHGAWSANASLPLPASDPVSVAVALGVLGSSFTFTDGDAAFLEVSSLSFVPQTEAQLVPLPPAALLLVSPILGLLGLRRAKGFPPALS